MVAPDLDFDSVFAPLGAVTPPKDAVSSKRKATDEGQRENLRVYETMPAQMLNAYGMAAFSKMSHEKVWEEFNKPLKTGAKYMTELCSAEEERRGVGINRFLQVLVEYMKYQNTDRMKTQNEFILKEEIYTQLYKEIDMIFAAAVYCLAGKKQYIKKGASGLRTAVSFEQVTKKSTETLKAHAQILYRWIGTKQSRLRMLMAYQAAGGLAYVSGTHLLGVQCFLSFGNTYHDGQGDKTVSLEAFQGAVVKRHEMELEGHEYLKSDEFGDDFKPLT
jgi:hypothetical protein